MGGRDRAVSRSGNSGPVPCQAVRGNVTRSTTATITDISIVVKTL